MNQHFDLMQSLFASHAADVNVDNVKRDEMVRLAQSLITEINRQMSGIQEYFSHAGMNGKTMNDLSVGVNSQQIPNISESTFIKHRREIKELLISKYGVNRVTDETSSFVNRGQIRFSIKINRYGFYA